LVNISSIDVDLNSTWYNWNGTNYSYSGPENIIFNESVNTLSVWSNDSFGNLNYSNVTFTIDTTSPSLGIISPIEGTNYSNATQLLNISATDDNLNSTWYNWNNTNETYTSSEEITFDEGSNTLHVWSNDTLGNINYTNVTFTIDSTFPTLAIISPIEDTYYNSSEQLLNISSDDANLDTTWYSWNETNATYINPENITFTDGNRTLEVWVNDTFGNVNYTSVTFTIDTIAPSLNIITPVNTTYDNATQLVNISSIDVDLNSTWYNWNGTNYSYSGPENIIFNESVNTLSVWSNDSVGNLNYSNVTFTIDTIAPLLNIVAPINTTYDNATQLVNISSTDDNSNSTWYNWNGTNYSYLSSENITFNEGPNILYVWSNDSVGHLNYSNVTFTISIPVVIPSSSGGSGGGGSSRVSTPVADASEQVINIVEENEFINLDDPTITENYIAFSEVDNVAFTIKSSKHTLSINKFDATTIVILIQSEPIVASLSIGSLYEFDLDNDSLKDLRMRYDGIDYETGFPILFIQKIDDKPNEQKKELEDALEGKTDNVLGEVPIGEKKRVFGFLIIQFVLFFIFGFIWKTYRSTWKRD